MNKEEILNKYIDLINKGYCCACNELNCIDNFPHAKITHAIRELQQENKKYKEVIYKAIEYLDDWLFNVGGMGACMEYKDIKEILDILKEVE